MVEKVKRFLAAGIECRIVTARVNSHMDYNHVWSHTKQVETWCLKHIGQKLLIQAEKDYDMTVLYDDRAIAVETDTGKCRGWIEEIEMDVPSHSLIDKADNL